MDFPSYDNRDWLPQWSHKWEPVSSSLSQRLGADCDSTVSVLGVCSKHAISMETLATMDAYMWHVGVKVCPSCSYIYALHGRQKIKSFE